MAHLRAIVLLLLAAVLLPAAAGCSGRPGPGSETPGETAATATSTSAPPSSSPTGGASPGPAGSATPAAAQPLPAGLQKILDRVAGLRGLPAPPALTVEFLPRSKLTATLDGLITDDDRQWAAQLTNLYRLMGIIENNQDYLEIYRSFSSGAVLGFYSPQDDTLWVVYNDGQDLNLDNLSRELEQTLAHEFVHAVQDYNFDLVATGEQFEDSPDADLVYRSLVEGDATVYDKLYRARYLASAPAAGAGTVISARLPAAPAAQIPNVPPAVVRDLYFPYTTGADWVQQMLQAKGAAQVDEWFTRPPAASSQILRPELLDQGWQPEDVALPDLAAALGPNFRRDSGGVMGEFAWRNWLQVQVSASAAANAGKGWAGDEYAVYKDGGDVAAVFRVRFADETEARQFASAQSDWFNRARVKPQAAGDLTLAELPDGDVAATTSVRGNEVLFALATNRALAGKALQALLRG